MPLFRLDRHLTLNLFKPLRYDRRGEDPSWLPILMYHSVSNDTESAVSPYYRVTTLPDRFEQQMQWLGELGFRGVSINEGLRRPSEGRLNGLRAVVITFDDGFRDFYTSAWPLLKSHQFTATMYLPTGFISNSRKSFCGRECLTWREVRELHHEGVQFGSHTVSHPRLSSLPWAEVESELASSKERVEQKIGGEITSFAYPYAFPQEDSAFRGRLSETLRQQGYTDCVTTMVGRVWPDADPYCLRRLPVNSCDDRSLLAAKLEGAYDWVGVPQACVRRVKFWAGRRSLSVAAGRA